MPNFAKISGTQVHLAGCFCVSSPTTAKFAIALGPGFTQRSLGSMPWFEGYPLNPTFSSLGADPVGRRPTPKKGEEEDGETPLG